MARRLLDVINVLNKGTTDRLMKEHGVDTLQKLANRYRKGDGMKDLVEGLEEAELRKALTVLNRRELQEVVYGALAFDSKADALISARKKKLGGIMTDLCGWSVNTFQQSTYDRLIEMLNRFGVDVEERNLDQLKKKKDETAADRKVRLQRVFPS